MDLVLRLPARRVGVVGGEEEAEGGFVKNFLKKIRAFWWNERPVPIKTRNIQEYEAEQRLKNPIFLERFGYKVYSQNDEDGIISEIFNRIGTTNKKFVEFGVQYGLESNSHFLLHKGWSGLWIEGNKKAVSKIYSIFAKPIKDKQLKILNAFITAKNINKLISVDGSINGKIDLLSIDIDGNDYWVWQAIKCIKPRVVVIEYNAKFPPEFAWIMEYNSEHIWQGDDEQGASLKALELLGSTLGYQLVGTSFTGSNAFFVQKNLSKNLFPKPATSENLYNPMRFISYISGHPAKKYIG